jgi:hypothetical protein
MPMTDQADIEAQGIFVKTPKGVDEIQQRTLRLGLLQRRVLLLVDGQRTVAELQKLAGNADVNTLLAELLALGCVEHLQARPGAPSRAAPKPAGSTLPAGLPPATTRTAAQVDMARHFMINTINRLLEQHSRLSLVRKIFDSTSAAELREHYPAWEEAIGSAWMGRKRLDELRDKLFEVL